MKKEFVPHELAVKLSEIGYNAEALTYYNHDGRLERSDEWAFGAVMEEKRDRNQCLAPLWQQAFDWFRANGYEAHVLASFEGDRDRVYFYNIELFKEGKFEREVFSCRNKQTYKNYPTYEEARQSCLERLIDIIGSK